MSTGRKVICVEVSNFGVANGLRLKQTYTVLDIHKVNNSTYISLDEIGAELKFSASGFVYAKETLDYSDILYPKRIYVEGLPVSQDD